MTKIIVIVLNWNNAPDTLECLASLEKIDYPDYEILLVDNGSTDNSLTQIRSRYPQLPILENGENLGYAEGNNRGLLEGLKRGAELLLLLNNDTIVSPHLLSELAKAAQKHPSAGVFGPKIYFYDDPATIWYAGGSVDLKTGRCYHIGWGAPEGYNEIKETDYICGCALAVRAQVVEKVGLLSPEYFLIWEEIDWCYRIRRAGYKCLYVPKARIWHKVSASFPEGNRGPTWQYYYYRNKLLFHRRHTNRRWQKDDFLELARLVQLTFSAKADLRRKSRAALAGIRDYFFGRFGPNRS
ncbi:MAG: glycosyltransferase family 2 protein [Verrucomicrobia bacterium]|nr:glycosyltransferase family 2 protein [Verrucomicrobiota bacterium]